MGACSRNAKRTLAITRAAIGHGRPPTLVCGILLPTVGQQDVAAEKPGEPRVEFREFDHVIGGQALSAATPATDENVAGTSALLALARIFQDQLLTLTEKLLLALAVLRECAFNLLEIRWFVWRIG